MYTILGPCVNILKDLTLDRPLKVEAMRILRGTHRSRIRDVDNDKDITGREEQIDIHRLSHIPK